MWQGSREFDQADREKARGISRSVNRKALEKREQRKRIATAQAKAKKAR